MSAGGRAVGLLVTSLLIAACGTAEDGADGPELGSGAGDDTVPSVERGRLDSPEGPLAWVRVGTGPATLVVHGGPGLDHRYLRAPLEPLARGRALVFYDQRGLGSSVPDSGGVDSLALSWEGTLEDLGALADRFADESGRVGLLAHSWGALPALAWAVSHPDRVRSLVLVSPVEPGRLFVDETRARQAELTDPGRRRVLDSLLALAPERRADPVFRSRVFRAAFRVTAPDPSALDRLELELVPPTAANGDLVARRVIGSAGEGIELWDELTRVDAPALVIHGAADVGPSTMVRALADSLPRGEVVLLEGVGHFPFVEAPARFSRVVDAFLRRVEGR